MSYSSVSNALILFVIIIKKIRSDIEFGGKLEFFYFNGHTVMMKYIFKYDTCQRFISNISRKKLNWSGNETLNLLLSMQATKLIPLRFRYQLKFLLYCILTNLTTLTQQISQRKCLKNYCMHREQEIQVQISLLQ